MKDARKQNFTKIFHNDVANDKTSTDAPGWECTTYIMTPMDALGALRVKEFKRMFIFS